MQKKRKRDESQPTLSEWLARKPNVEHAAAVVDECKHHFLFDLAIELYGREYSTNEALLSISFPISTAKTEIEVEIQDTARANTETPHHRDESSDIGDVMDAGASSSGVAISRQETSIGSDDDTYTSNSDEDDNLTSREPG